MLTPQAEPGIRDNHDYFTDATVAPDREQLATVVRLPVGSAALRLALETDRASQPFTDEDVLGEDELRNVKFFARTMLGVSIDDSKAASFRVYAEQFGLPLFEASRIIDEGKRDTVTQRVYELRRYLSGANNQKIKEEVGAPSDATVGVSRNLSIKKVMHRYFSVGQHVEAFRDYLDTGLLPDVASITPAKNEHLATKKTLAAAAIERGLTPAERIHNSITNLIGPADPEASEVMERHLLGKPIDADSPGFVRASDELQRQAGMALKRCRLAQRNGSSLPNSVDLHDYRLIDKFVTDKITFREPWTIQHLIRERALQKPGYAADVNDIIKELLSVIERIVLVNS